MIYHMTLDEETLDPRWSDLSWNLSVRSKFSVKNHEVPTKISTKEREAILKTHFIRDLSEIGLLVAHNVAGNSRSNHKQMVNSLTSHL
jgi:hypothetical protein